MAFRLTGDKIQLSESDVAKACKHLLALRGYWRGRNHAGLFLTYDGKRPIRGEEKGTPDYVFVHERYPGFLLEVKRPGGKLSPDQVRKIAEIRMGYRLAIAVVDSVEELAAWLDEHERKRYANRL